MCGVKGSVLDFGFGVRVLWLFEIASLICNFCLSVAAAEIVQADMLWGRSVTKKQCLTGRGSKFIEFSVCIVSRFGRCFL